VQVKLIYTTQLKDALGCAGEPVELSDSATLGELLDELGRRHGDTFQEFVWAAPGKLRASMIICIGNTTAHAELTTVLRDGDEILLLSPVSGG
jgi:molybdopterin converting factor small subunit